MSLATVPPSIVATQNNSVKYSTAIAMLVLTATLIIGMSAGFMVYIALSSIIVVL